MSILLCLILAVPDGDSLRAQCEGHAKPIAIRMAEIDAPEVKHSGFVKMAEQPYGKAAQQHLSGLCYKVNATVHTRGKDRYGRTLAHVDCNGVQANAEMVRAGLAWSYLPAKRSPMPALEAEAKAAGLGLWADPNPIPPSKWRKLPSP